MPSLEYGSNLNANILESKFPHCNRYWAEINEKRNPKTDAHPYELSLVVTGLLWTESSISTEVIISDGY